MKKSIALVAMAFGVTSAFAQDLTSKKGEPFLPEAGDYAIAIDATPFFSYAKGLIGAGSNAGATSPNWNWANPNATIWGKMFKDANTAYRAGIRLGFGSQTTRTMVAQLYTAASTPTTVTFPTASAQVENVMKTSQTNIGLTAGIEKRRGKTRLQGVYGAEVGLMLNSSKDKYTYGNSLVASNTASAQVVVTGADAMNGGSNLTTDSQGNTARITTWKSGMGFAFGVRGFVGAEYFVAPKISIGGEFGWGLGFGLSGKSTTSIEAVGNNGTDNVVGTQETKGNKSSSFGLDIDNNNSIWGPSATLKLNLHF